MRTMTTTRGQDEFTALADPYRRELMAHCYRMLGSVHDAEDLVQETYIRAWRAYDRFEGRSSLRTWLYRIATSACLTALESRKRRPLPTGLGAPSSDPADDVSEQSEVPWLEPAPDTAVGADAADPATIVTSRESVRLAFIAALQYLPPRQRAVLVLRDVLRWQAAEVAEAIGISTAAVNSLLQRARTHLKEVHPDEESVQGDLTAEQRLLLDRYAAAFEAYDIDALVELFTSDAVWEMPPFPTWYQGPAAIGSLIASQCPASAPGDMRMVPARANGQPAFAVYMRGEDGIHHRFGIQVLSVSGPSVAHVGMFFDPALFDVFGLPASLPAAPQADRPLPV